MKRTVLLSALLALAITACGKEEATAPATAPAQAQSEPAAQAAAPATEAAAPSGQAQEEKK
jgi:nitrous oxide reductase accessory protein NosL